MDSLKTVTSIQAKLEHRGEFVVLPDGMRAKQMETSLRTITREIVDRSIAKDQKGVFSFLDPATIALLVAALAPLIQKLVERIAGGCDDSLDNVANTNDSRFMRVMLAWRVSRRLKLLEQFRGRKNSRNREQAARRIVKAMFEIAEKRGRLTASRILASPSGFSSSELVAMHPEPDFG